MMTSRNYYWLIAGIICLLTALVHTIGGQFELVDPLMVGSLSPTAKVQWLGVWHVVTVMLFGGAFWLIRGGWLPASASLALLNNIAYLFVLFAMVFVVASIAQGIHALQWVLLLPIGLLTIIGSRRVETTNVNQELN